MKTPHKARLSVDRIGAPDVVKQLRHSAGVAADARFELMSEDVAEAVRRAAALAVKAADRIVELELERDMLRDYADTSLKLARDCADPFDVGSPDAAILSGRIIDVAEKLGFVLEVKRSDGTVELMTEWVARANGLLG